MESCYIPSCKLISLKIRKLHENYLPVQDARSLIKIYTCKCKLSLYTNTGCNHNLHLQIYFIICVKMVRHLTNQIQKVRGCMHRTLYYALYLHSQISLPSHYRQSQGSQLERCLTFRYRLAQICMGNVSLYMGQFQDPEASTNFWLREPQRPLFIQIAGTALCNYCPMMQTPCNDVQYCNRNFGMI